MAMFNSYVKLPKGRFVVFFFTGGNSLAGAFYVGNGWVAGGCWGLLG